MSKEYNAGWKMAARWAQRDDLWADINSPAFLRDKAVALSGASNDSDAASPSTQWETRYKALLGALQGICDEYDSAYGLDLELPSSRLRDILHRNS